MSYPDDPETYEIDDVIDRSDEWRKRQKGEE